MKINVNDYKMRRHEALKPLSRGHHLGLLLCFHIREGLKKHVDTERIKAYADFMWENHLKQHFITEEKFLFPILKNNNVLIIRALNEHKRLDDLFHTDTDLSYTLSMIEKKLEEHIRYEERNLFNVIQEKANDFDLENLLLHSKETLCPLWKDEFWN